MLLCPLCYVEVTNNVSEYSSSPTLWLTSVLFLLVFMCLFILCVGRGRVVTGLMLLHMCFYTAHGDINKSCPSSCEIVVAMPLVLFQFIAVQRFRSCSMGVWLEKKLMFYRCRTI